MLLKIVFLVFFFFFLSLHLLPIALIWLLLLLLLLLPFLLLFALCVPCIGAFCDVFVESRESDFKNITFVYHFLVHNFFFLCCCCCCCCYFFCFSSMCVHSMWTVNDKRIFTFSFLFLTISLLSFFCVFCQLLRPKRSKLFWLLFTRRLSICFACRIWHFLSLLPNSSFEDVVVVCSSAFYRNHFLVAIRLFVPSK